MSLPTIFDNCTPRADVLDSTIAEADFAADLAKVIRNEGSVDYRDPVRFFSQTYPTTGLRNLLQNVLARLTGDPSATAAIFRLDTSYGGGKTHGLIALAHAARGMKGVKNVSEFIESKLIPKGNVRIAAFDGENADPANGRNMGDGVLAHSPWGELAYTLAGKAGYDRVRKSDETHTAPGAETLAELFGGEPCLILLDELSVYLRKVANLPGARDQLSAFLTSLFKAVESSPRVALVYTLAIGKDGKTGNGHDDDITICCFSCQGGQRLASIPRHEIVDSGPDGVSPEFTSRALRFSYRAASKAVAHLTKAKTEDPEAIELYQTACLTLKRAIHVHLYDVLGIHRPPSMIRDIRRCEPPGI